MPRCEHDEDEIIKKIKALTIGFNDASGAELKMKSEAIDELRNKLNADKTKQPVIICTNCGLVTRSVFTFTEHYEYDETGNCDDVHY